MMRLITRFTLALAFLTLTSYGIPAAAGHQDDKSASELLEQMGNAQSTDAARDELRKLAQSDASVRKLLVDRLPGLIESGPSHAKSSSPRVDEVWLNAVGLAGEFKISEAAPALAKWLSVSTNATRMNDLTAAEELRYHPAGLSLVQIGDPALPALQAVLDTGTIRDRWSAARALILIGTPKAKGVLRAAAQTESDPTLANHMRLMATN
jgi:HEAT repeat protein